MKKLLVFLLFLSACSPYLPATATPVPPTVTAQATATRQPAPKAAPSTPDPTARVIATSLHVRAEPMGLRIGYLYAADTVTLTGTCRDGWAQIEWRDSTAWVNARFLSENSCQTNKE